MLPTPGTLELETHSSLRSSLSLTISPWLAMGPDDTLLSDLSAYIPAPEVCDYSIRLDDKHEVLGSPTTLTGKV